MTSDFLCCRSMKKRFNRSCNKVAYGTVNNLVSTTHNAVATTLDGIFSSESEDFRLNLCKHHQSIEILTVQGRIEFMNQGFVSWSRKKICCCFWDKSKAFSESINVRNELIEIWVDSALLTRIYSEIFKWTEYIIISERGKHSTHQSWFEHECIRL